MSEFLVGENIPEDIKNYTEALNIDKDLIIREMEEKAENEGFPIVGARIGGWLEQITRMTGSKKVFEFGSGFGYSAYWIARGLPEDGKIVLTDFKSDNIDKAKEFFQKSDIEVEAIFEEGNALETIKKYEEEFDIILIDMKKHQYLDAFKKAKERLSENGILIADDAISASRHEKNDLIDFNRMYKYFVEGDSFEELECTELQEENMEGIIEFLDEIRDQEGFTTTLLPLGDGLTISYKK